MNNHTLADQYDATANDLLTAARQAADEGDVISAQIMRDLAYDDRETAAELRNT